MIGKLSHLLRAGLLTPVYHGESGVRTLRELSRSYLTVNKDLTRVMDRLKARGNQRRRRYNNKGERPAGIFKMARTMAKKKSRQGGAVSPHSVDAGGGGRRDGQSR